MRAMTMQKYALGFFAAGVLFLSPVSVAQASNLSAPQIQAVLGLLQSFNIDPAIIARVQNALYGYASSPTPLPPVSGGTFYLNSSFSLSVGQSAQQYQGGLAVQLKQVSPQLSWGYIQPTSAEVLLTAGCMPGTYCMAIYAPQQTFVLTLGQSAAFQGYTVLLTSLSPTTATFTVTGTGQGVLAAPKIFSVTPAQAPVGTQISLLGTGFTNDNTIRFGTTEILHVPSFNNGTLLYFTIPTESTTNCGYNSATACYGPVSQVLPGNYQIYVLNANGQSDAKTVTVTSQYSNNALTITSPAAGQSYQRGQTMSIAWNGNTSGYGNMLAFDLYTQAGNKIGTIAMTSENYGTYQWAIPPANPNYACTMQYPNGLCGILLQPGLYKIRASLQSNYDGAWGAPVAESGTFTIY